MSRAICKLFLKLPNLFLVTISEKVLSHWLNPKLSLCPSNYLTASVERNLRGRWMDLESLQELAALMFLPLCSFGSDPQVCQYGMWQMATCLSQQQRSWGIFCPCSPFVFVWSQPFNQSIWTDIFSSILWSRNWIFVVGLFCWEFVTEYGWTTVTDCHSVKSLRVNVSF